MEIRVLVVINQKSKKGKKDPMRVRARWNLISTGQLATFRPFADLPPSGLILRDQRVSPLVLGTGNNPELNPGDPFPVDDTGHGCPDQPARRVEALVNQVDLRGIPFRCDHRRQKHRRSTKGPHMQGFKRGQHGIAAIAAQRVINPPLDLSTQLKQAVIRSL